MELNVEDAVEIAFPEDLVREIVLGSNIHEVKDNRDEVEMMMGPLAEFLLIPVNKQFQYIFQEVFASMSTKKQAKSNANIE